MTMKQRLTLGGALVGIAIGLTLAAVVPWALREQADALSAEEVAARLAAAEDDLIASLQPETTFHMIANSNRTLRHGPAPDESVNETEETWMYFDATGNVAAYRFETRDAATGTVKNSVTMEDGVYVHRDGAGNLLFKADWGFSLNTLRTVMLDAQLRTLTLVDPRAPAPTEQVDGKTAYVIDRMPLDSDHRQRTYIDVSEFRTLKWERILPDGTIVESKATPLFEFLDGNQVPGATPPAATPEATPTS